MVVITYLDNLCMLTLLLVFILNSWQGMRERRKIYLWNAIFFLTPPQYKQKNAFPTKWATRSENFSTWKSWHVAEENCTKLSSGILTDNVLQSLTKLSPSWGVWSLAAYPSTSRSAATMPEVMLGRPLILEGAAMLHLARGDVGGKGRRFLKTHPTASSD